MATGSRTNQRPGIATLLLVVVVIGAVLLLGPSLAIFAGALTLLWMSRGSVRNVEVKHVLMYIVFLVVAYLVVAGLALAFEYGVYGGTQGSTTSLSVDLAALTVIIISVIIFLYLWRKGAFRGAAAKPKK